MLEMNAEIRARWTAALRSGEYEQGKNDLHKGSRWCCLGVLCDLAAKDGIVKPGRAPDGVWEYDGDTGVLPQLVWDWAGLDDSSPIVDVALLDDEERYGHGLTALNDDDGWTFAQIADAIDGTSQTSTAVAG